MRKKLTLIISGVVFLILALTMIIVGTVMSVLIQKGVILNDNNGSYGRIIVILVFAISSLVFGSIISLLVIHNPIRYINRLISSMNRLAKGDYSTRISMGKGKIGSSVEKSFNKMAEELENTDMLRSDFINGLSHEFKTPIVSIRGFAKLLKKSGLTESERMEYLNIIDEESQRLARLSNNVLELTKLENQSILTDVTYYNLSEQIRRVMVLLEKKWSARNIVPILDFKEYFITANEELLKQVWINLIDNAVKFVPEAGELEVKIAQNEDGIRVDVINEGQPISEEEKNRIFRKFYQSDKSHSSEGNGIGLSIVKRIVELHNGSIDVNSGNGRNNFSIFIPKV